jgi:hypothetical protein
MTPQILTKCQQRAESLARTNVARVEASKARWIGVLKCNSDDQETVRRVQKHIDKLDAELKFYMQKAQRASDVNKKITRK